MNRYKDAVALRRGLEVRLVRLVAAPGGCWILKDGAALELRLLDRARMTKDLDLAIRANQSDGTEVRESLIDALAGDPDQDGFVFRVGAPAALAADREGRPAWRFSVEAWLAGKLFAGVRLDIAARHEELARTEFVQLPGTLSFAGVPACSIEAVDRLQHFAEKLHALTRGYPDRSNTRQGSRGSCVAYRDRAECGPRAGGHSEPCFRRTRYPSGSGGHPGSTACLESRLPGDLGWPDKHAARPHLRSGPCTRVLVQNTEQ